MDNPTFEPEPVITERKNANKLNGCGPTSELTKNANGHAHFANSGEQKVKLQREVGLLSGIGLIVGVIIGSGIFVSPGGLIAETGSVWLSLCVWLACGFISTLGAITYIELGSVVPSSGGEYAYIGAAFGRLPAFLYSWIATIVLKPSGVAIVCLTFAEYCISPFLPMLGFEEGTGFEVPALKWASILICSATLLLVTYINCASVRVAVLVQNYFTLAKLVALLIIIVGGIYNLATGRVGQLNTGFDGSKWEYGPLAAAFYSGLWAFDGWNSLNYITEEIKNPYRNLPVAILLALPLVTFVYFFVNVSYFTVATVDEIINEPVAIIFGTRMLGPMAFLMPLAVSISTFGSANGSQFTAGRLCYVTAREGQSIEAIAYIDVRRKTPSFAMVFNAVLGISMTVFLDIGSLIHFFSFTAWIFYAGTFASLIRLRFTRPDAPRPFKVPIVIPAVLVLISMFLVVAPVMDNPQVEYLFALGFIALGFFVYWPFCHYYYVLPGMGEFTYCMQMLFKIIPPEIDTNAVSVFTNPTKN